MAESHVYAILRCDACGAPINDEYASSGLLVFVRDGEVRFEEPPLCASCSVAIGVTAFVRWAEEEDEG